jgi:hypothetical protein
MVRAPGTFLAVLTVMRLQRVVLSSLLVSAGVGIGTGCAGDIGNDNSGSGGGDDDGVGGPGSDGGPGEFGPDAPVCDQNTPITATQTNATPDMLLVVDKSGSMDDPLGTGEKKIVVMKDALSQVLPTHDAKIHYGLLTYPSGGQCGAGTVLTPIAPMNAANVIAAVTPVTPGGYTPTYKAIAAAGTYYGTIPANPDGRFVLLATDGLPNCNGGNTTPSVDQSVAAIAALAAQGIKTFVIGFGDVAAADPTTLTAFAQAGGTTDFYAASSPQQLQQALESISGAITTVSCTFALATTPADVDKLTVTLNGTVIVRDLSHQTGWDYDPATNSINFYGDTCASIKAGAGGAIGVNFGCEGGPVIR